MQKIMTFLWFDKEAEEATNFYVSIFKDSKVVSISRYPEGGPAPAGTVMTTKFELEGQEFVALNGGPTFKFTEAISLVVNCTSQEEVDYYWEKLSAGGTEVQCGWLKDKYGLSWQITPTILIELMSSNDAKQNERVMQAMMKMVKIDIETIKRAAAGE
jgi:predicted 3-demethylubiquinone-9 3-methyltransferase (glyoxalase superfamily)